MRIDKTQRGWAITSLIILAASAAVYWFSALGSPQGPRGGSAIGLAFGVTGFGFMIFAALLGARKRVPTWRIGRAQAWMRGHLWLGLLSLPVILFHGGFHFGGTLTSVLKLETIYDEIGNVRQLLREEADRGVETICGPLGLGKSEKEEMQRAGGFSAARARAMAATSGGAAVAAAAETVVL